MGWLHDVRNRQNATEYVYVSLSMTSPIKITDKAASQITSLVQKGGDGIIGLRLAIGTTGCSGNSYKMEHIKADEDVTADEKFEDNDAAIYIPRMHSWMLFGMTIDYITDDLGNTRFDFINPNEVGRCGCGESFQVDASVKPKN